MPGHTKKKRKSMAKGGAKGRKSYAKVELRKEKATLEAEKLESKCRT